MNATTRATFDELRDGFAKANPGRDPLTPPAQGLYDPSKEHDSCGVGFVADMKNRKSHDILEKGLQILVNLDHRGAVGADPSLGDGCGVLTQIPHAFFAPECAKLGFDLPAQGHYAIGQFFMPRRSEARKQVQAIVEEVVAAEGLNAAGLARCARRQFRAWRTRQGGRAGDAADFHRTPNRTRQRRRF